VGVELEDQRPPVGDDAVAGPVEAVCVGLEAVAQRDARHAQAVLGVGEEPGQKIALLVVEPAEVLGDDAEKVAAAFAGPLVGR
jgi:hypothetical protein